MVTLKDLIKADPEWAEFLMESQREEIEELKAQVKALEAKLAERGRGT